MQPVSVVATVLNEAEDIGRVVASLLGQDPPAAEVIVVDGGASDGTWEGLWAGRRRGGKGVGGRGGRRAGPGEALAGRQGKGRDANTTGWVAIRAETCSLKSSA